MYFLLLESGEIVLRNSQFGCGFSEKTETQAERERHRRRGKEERERRCGDKATNQE
jgi:hypothetical protein